MIRLIISKLDEYLFDFLGELADEKFNKRIGGLWKKIKRFSKLVSPILLILMGGSWLPDGIKDFFDKGQWGWAVLGLLMFIWGSWWVYVQRREYFYVHISAKSEIPPRKVLVMPISPLTVKETCVSPGMASAKAVMPISPLTVKETLLMGNELSNRIDEVYLQAQSMDILKSENTRINFTFPWQQTMRGIAKHQSELDCVYLIGSKGGSFAQLGDCEGFIKHYLPHLEIRCWEKEVDFEDLEALLDQLYDVIKDARKNNYGLRDIMMDVTAGQKTISIAAALVTLNLRALEFQYVSTTPPHRVIAFNTNAEKNEIEI